jgi:hypothetical protein
MCARRCELINERAPDIAGGACDKNCVHATKDGAGPRKVTADPCNFSRRYFVVST